MPLHSRNFKLTYTHTQALKIEAVLGLRTLFYFEEFRVMKVKLKEQNNTYNFPSTFCKAARHEDTCENSWRMREGESV